MERWNVCRRSWILGAFLPIIPTFPLSAQTFEQRLLAVPDTASVRQMSHDLSAVPHMAGTPAQAATRDYVLDRMKSWGIDAWSKEYTVYLPQPDTVAAWIITGRRATPLALAEPGTGPQIPPFNGYTGDGDVTADVIYVNYGLIEDYKTLDSLGQSVKGKVAIARYGRSFRGIKAREAQKRGAVGLIVYSDPQEDGYFRGDVYPKGPMRNADGIQRGSMMNGNGDPTTPSWSSVEGARRLSEDSLDIPKIPIIPMSYGNARRFLEPMAGASVPQNWQGGLPFRYHVGPGPARARLHVKTERGARAFHKIWNTVGMIRGSRWPDEWVVVGGHRDAWGPGARDNVSGTVSVLETARAFATLARDGQKPARTVVFATWDAEEWGLIGPQRRHDGPDHEQPGRRLGFLRLLSSSGDSRRGYRVRRAGRHLSLDVRLLRLDDTVRRSELQGTSCRCAARGGDHGPARQCRPAAARLRGIRHRDGWSRRPARFRHHQKAMDAVGQHAAIEGRAGSFHRGSTSVWNRA
ncbi:MAG: hypothetical protein DMD40_11870 [Gemmatimonadetes bacterium]|nr:MAG: hypothetical protein DMD40_11870 [Gemmatimonadota bacterium]